VCDYGISYLFPKKIRDPLLSSCKIGFLNYSPKIIFDTSKPNGQSRRVLRNDKAQKILGFSAETSLIDGLRKTIDWYQENKLN